MRLSQANWIFVHGRSEIFPPDCPCPTINQHQILTTDGHPMSLFPRRLPPPCPPRILCIQCQFHVPQRRLQSTNSQPPSPDDPSSSSASSTSAPQLPSASRNPRSLSERTAQYIDTLQLRALSAGQKLNDVTGYSAIESLKTKITQQGPPPSFSPLLPYPVASCSLPSEGSILQSPYVRGRGPASPLAAPTM